MPTEELPPVWAYLLALLALVVAGFVFGQIVLAARQFVPGDPDIEVLAWVHQHHHDWRALDRLFHMLTWLGNFGVAVPSTIAVAIVLVLLGRRRVARLRKREALFWLGVALGGRILCVILKLAFQRQRPPAALRLIVIDDESFSFPSGHAMYAAVFFTMLAILLGRLLASFPAWVRWLGYAACAALAMLVASSRVWLAVHYPTDVAAGLVLGVAWVILAYLIRFSWRSWRILRNQRPIEPTPSAG